jgi:phosphatidylethanolamine-binding protein (PEBP) family uncharacterized protein
MRLITTCVAILVLATMAAFTSNKTLTVTSYAFTNNGNIPVKYTCVGQQASPPLSIGNIPAGAKSLAIVVDDPDELIKPVATAAPATKSKAKHKKPTTPKHPATESKPDPGCFTHWVIWNIDVDGGSIPENFKNDNEGTNSAQQIGYAGLCPPTGTHHYHFKVYALDTKLNIPKSSDKAALEKVMQGHIVAWGELVGVFNKTYR